MILLVPPPAWAATATDIRLAVTAGSMAFDAASNAEAQDASWFAASDNGARMNASISIEAQSLTVNWTRSHGAGVGRSPGDPGETFASYMVPPSNGEQSYSDAQVRAESWNHEANWMLISLRSVSVVDGGGFGQGLISTAGEASWFAGPPGGVQLGLPSSAAIGQSFDVPPERPHLRSWGASTLRIEGTAVLYLWGINATVNDGEGRRDSYASGEWTETPDGQGTIERPYQQFVAIRVENGTLRLQQDHSTLRAAAERFAFDGINRLQLTDASGNLAAGVVDLALSEQDVELQGAFGAQVQPDESGRLGLLAAGPATAAALDGQRIILPENSAARRARLPSVTVPFFILVSVGGVFAWAGLAWRQRRSNRALSGAEAALLRHRPHRARRRLRTLLAPGDKNADAWFLYGATCLQENDPDRVIQELTPVAERFHGSDRRGLAFLLALAHARLQNADGTVRWLGAALDEPLFRKRASQEPEFLFLRTDARFLRMVHEHSAAYG